MDKETQVQSPVVGVNGTVVRPEPEVLAMAKRRQFAMTYKRRTVRAAAACKEPGEIGALLRREGLYRSPRSSAQPLRRRFRQTSATSHEGFRK
jgi:transposase